MFDWEVGLDYNKKILDTIDIKPYLIKRVDLRDVQGGLYEDYRHIVKDDPFMEGDLFNFMDRYDFMLYLRDRYKDIKINFWEEEHYEVM